MAKPRIYHHKEPAQFWSEDMSNEHVNRIEVLAIVEDSSVASLCLLSRYGDAEISRIDIIDWCETPDLYIKQVSQCSAALWSRYDQLWLVSLSSSTSKWRTERLVNDLSCDFKDVPSINFLPIAVLENAFSLSVEGIGDLARLGKLACTHVALTNLDSVALAACVYAQRLAARPKAVKAAAQEAA